jgi:hypothetical protein
VGQFTAKSEQGRYQHNIRLPPSRAHLALPSRRVYLMRHAPINHSFFVSHLPKYRFRTTQEIPARHSVSDSPDSPIEPLDRRTCCCICGFPTTADHAHAKGLDLSRIWSLQRSPHPFNGSVHQNPTTPIMATEGLFSPNLISAKIEA